MKSDQVAEWGTLTSMDDDDAVYWRRNFMHQPFYFEGLSFEDYAPALRMGHARYRQDTLFEDVQCRLGSEWEQIKGKSRLSWFEARHAVRAAWERADELVLG
jgi:hypothetical protein